MTVELALRAQSEQGIHLMQHKSDKPSHLQGLHQAGDTCGPGMAENYEAGPVGIPASLKHAAAPLLQTQRQAASSLLSARHGTMSVLSSQVPAARLP